MSLFSAAHWLKPPEEEAKKKRFSPPRYFTKDYIRKNLRKVMFIVVYCLINVVLFTVSAVRYRYEN